MMCNLMTLWLLLCLLCTSSGASYKSCQINVMTKKCIPSSSICVQNAPGETIGSCKCAANYIFNEHFVTDDDYCLPTKLTTLAPNEESTISDISIVKANNSSYTKDVFLGVLIVIVLICLILSAGFIIYKYGIWNWFCTKISERGRPPQYEDVMIGQEDTDDDPLP